jgi:hypothetical protein
LSEASSFRLGKCDDFLALERQPAVFLFVIFFFLMAERKSKSPAARAEYVSSFPVAQNEDTTFLPINLSKTT